jgi:hypothetical protein
MGNRSVNAVNLIEFPREEVGEKVFPFAMVFALKGCSARRHTAPEDIMNLSFLLRLKIIK